MTEILKLLHTLTLSGAKRVRDHALKDASSLGLSVSVVIVDRTGVILLMETSDDTPAGAPEASIMKAKSADRYGVATHSTAEYLKNLAGSAGPTRSFSA
jgi:uncharacterized protein GlcG (DUF336 family)